MKSTVWTARRRALGNLVPLPFWLVPTLAGLVWMALRAEIVPAALWLLGAGIVAGWFGINLFGLHENARMRRELERILRADGGELCPDRIFVGYASPRYASLVDAHEDVGFLCFLPDRLRFMSETRTVEFLKIDARAVRFRPNVHTMVGLGRWVSIEGDAGGRRVKMYIEPRERKTLMGNLRMSGQVWSKVRRWMREPAAENESGGTPVVAN